ncbi:unnamed protein product, partial [Pocillopora meandrina]
MSFELTSVVLLLSLAFLLAPAKHLKKHKTKMQDTETLPKRYDKVKYRGEWKNCDYFHTKDDFGSWCNCPFVACTGSQECTTMGGFFCRFLHDNVNVEDMDRSD